MLFLNKLLKEVKGNPTLFKNPKINYILGLVPTQTKELKKFALQQGYIIQNKQEYFLTEEGNEYLKNNPIESWNNIKFPKRPNLNLEYLKTETPSATVTRAIRNLAKYLLDKETLKPNSIESFIYDDLLSENSEFKEIQTEMKAFFYHNERVCLAELYDKFLSYGLTKSIISILLLNILAENRHKIAVYEKHQFILNIDSLLFDKIMLCPQKFELQATILEDNQLLENLSDLLLPNKSKNILELTRGLIKFIKSLDKYVIQTERLSQKAIKLRNTVLNAKDPINLFMVDIPLIVQKKLLKDCSKGLIGEFKKVINELKTATDIMIDEIQEFTLKAFNSRSRKELSNRFENVKELISSNELKVLYNNVTDNSVSSRLWIERIVTCINGERVPKDWKDSDIAEYKAKIKELALKLQALEVVNGGTTYIITTDFSNVLSKILSLSKTEQLLLIRKIANN